MHIRVFLTANRIDFFLPINPTFFVSIYFILVSASFLFFSPILFCFKLFFMALLQFVFLFLFPNFSRLTFLFSSCFSSNAVAFKVHVCILFLVPFYGQFIFFYLFPIIFPSRKCVHDRPGGGPHL